MANISETSPFSPDQCDTETPELIFQGPACSLPSESSRHTGEAANEARPRRRPAAVIATFLLMMATWLVLSNMRDAFHIVLGVISSGIVAWFSSDMLFSSAAPVKSTRVAWYRFPLYIPWLLWQIFMANLWVLYLVFHPRMRDMINPRIITFRSNLKSRMAQITFANSITLTPGTITVDVDWNGTFTVHALDEKSAIGLPGEMEQRVARVFGED